MSTNLNVNPARGQVSRDGSSIRQPVVLDLDSWPGNMDTYMPELDVGKSIARRLAGDPGKGLFCSNDRFTSVDVLEKPNSEQEAKIWYHHNLIDRLRAPHPGFRMLCLRMKDEEGHDAGPASRLAISREMFRHVANHLSLPPSFINCLMKYRGGAPIFQGSRIYTPKGSEKPVYDFWNIMRIRTASSCLDKPPHRSHTPGHAHQAAPEHNPHSEEYQMDPFNLLHLPLDKSDPGKHTDVLSLELGVFFRYDTAEEKTTVLTVNTGTTKVKELRPEDFQDAVNAVFQHAESDESRKRKDPFWFHLIYTGLALQTWRTALLKFQSQLIKHDETIEDHIATGKPRRSADRPDQAEPEHGESVDTLSATTNQSLHAMTAHGLRYETELVGLVNVLEELLKQHERIRNYLPAGKEEWERVHDALFQRLAEAKSVVALQRELTKKTKNTLAFLFHAITSEQATRQTENGSDLKQILGLNQKDVALTITLSKQMRTIAVVTMLFLPAATIAAVMSLPYFGDDDRPKKHIDARNYAICTTLITIVVLVVYGWHYRRKKLQEEREAGKDGAGVAVNGSASGWGHRGRAVHRPKNVENGSAANGLGLELRDLGDRREPTLPLYQKWTRRIYA